MNIFPNEIIKNPSTNKRFRVLWTDSNNRYVYLIDIDDKNSFPTLRKSIELIDQIVEGCLIKEKTEINNWGDGEIGSNSIKLRDSAWELINEIVKREPDIYIPKKRGELIKEIISKNNVTKPTIYKYLSRYWQGGKVPNALIPHYSRCGGKGKIKKPQKKMGRPSKYENLQTNVIVTEDIKKIFRVTLQKYYFNQKKPSLKHAHTMMVRHFYLEDTYFENGEEKVILKDRMQIPSLNQLRYFMESEYTAKEKKSSRIGKTKFDQQYRELLGSSTFETFGPGSRFQIDATIADVFLISEYNPDWIIGRPVVYFVVDVFSRMIAGMYVGLEGPSWIGGLMAITNTVSDKKVFCAEFGIDIEKNQWPCEHLPEILLADRGEFEGYNVERLISAFNLQVENTPPYRPDLKGLVEKYFDIFQGKVKPFIPGYIDKDYRERGAKDYRLDAKLTLKDFAKIMISEVLSHNNHQYIDNYPRDVEMINDNVKPIPIELWNWGIKNRSGKLSYHNPNLVKLHLLPKDTASVTESGIRFKKMHYICDKAVKQSWFSTANIKGSWKVNIAYDPRDMTNIYILNDNGMEYEVCKLLPKEERYSGKSLDEIEYLLNYEDKDQKEYEHTQLTEDINLINKVESVVSSSIQNANQTQTKNLSKEERVGSIRANRAHEKLQQRKKEAFHLESQDEILYEEATINNKEVEETEDSMNYNRKSIKDILNSEKISKSI